MSFKVSKATISQAAEIHALCKSCFAAHDGRIAPPSSMERETIDGYQRHITEDNCVIVKLGDKIVGCIFYKSEDGGLYFYKLAIAPDYHRQGLAQKLLSHIENEAISMGISNIKLNVRVELTENISLFVKQGYIETARGAHKGFDKPTYIIMEKLVTA